jgi:hydrogenase maturation protein HypF
MCADCKNEYDQSSDRRFHAQTQACMKCGPTFAFANAEAEVIEGDAIRLAAEVIRRRGILAVKGVGGFLLMCDATQIETVKRLRKIKRRPDKPLALMTINIKTVSTYSDMTSAAGRMLTGSGCPIVLLRKKKDRDIAWFKTIAGKLDTLGWMLPSSPVYHLLLHELDGCPDFQVYQHEVSASVLVATSGNISGDVIIADNDEVITLFKGVVDGFLLHDREIVHRSDDSVIRMHQGLELWLRRARSYAPAPITLSGNDPPVIAVGADLKSTLCFTRDHQAFLSPHIGDLENPDANRLAHESLHSFTQLLDIRPEAIACDLHPDFHSTRLAAAYANELGVPLIQVQHHHAHVESVMAEHHLGCPVIGLVLDGYGFGPDGTAWGGECLRVEGGEYQRLGRFRPFVMPGGDMAAREPWRMAVSFLSSVGDGSCKLIAELFPEQEGIDTVVRLCSLELGMWTSSAGRLLDAAQAIVTGMDRVTYEGQAAIEFEALAGGELAGEIYPSQLKISGELLELDFTSAFSALAKEKLDGVPTSVLSRRFHGSFIKGVVDLVVTSAAQADVGHVVLAGGCLANELLATTIIDRLNERGIQVWQSRQLPAGDGGISLGQARVAQLLLKQRRGE